MSKKRVVIFFVIFIVVVIGFVVVAGGGSNQHSLAQIEYPLAPADEPINMVNEAILFNESKWTTNHTHDGEIIKVDDSYYVFSTDYMVGADPTPGIMVRKSTDLVHWEFVGRVFESVPEEVSEHTNGATIFWAPDVVEMNNKFYLYYSVSEFGTKNSFIGLATSDSIEGPWVDRGEVFKTSVQDDYAVNAIDPGIVFDRNDQPWMVFGSYQGGIFITELDRETGKLMNPGDQGTMVANKGSDLHQPLEGPAIMYNNELDYFYLTLSYGWLEDTYNVRIGRSKEITGPYLDYNGNDLVDIATRTGSPDVGTKIIGPYGFENGDDWQGTGHNGLLKDGDDYFIIHNARVERNKFWSHLHVRKLFWTEDGWPIASPQRYAGETEQEIKSGNIIGEWEQIVFDRLDDRITFSKKLTLLENGKINDETSEDYWELTNDNILRLYWHAPDEAPNDYWVDSVIVATAWDWENWNETIVFSGLNQRYGEAIWGKLVVHD
ncbi:arabinan endo-1,5-alpha-L-arabinosidase [Halalkalibacter akibai]|uniref:Glycoside hydrolase n=1 Tax=Halalkalibacter akibai (strain ATCC 43226 / DSM 21942 / CIP 109018 / JCM 9157 / 1139) TaxID=1236973 RepID=W4QPY4_HALA3|nr:arabinan endo-1,5-alpha-L-arabinosidase [Halalkalibacter akibai]GAE33957.1 glycoside hydrolase [Halalkalibacter akibai JCM 9157]